MMKHVLGATLIVLALLSGVASAATMEPDLANRLAAADANEKLAVDFFMKAQANALSLDGSIENLPKPQRRARVAAVLQEYSAATQRDLLDYLKSQENAGKVDDIRSLWLCNLVGCWATKDVIYAVAARTDVDLVVYGKVPVEISKPDLTTPLPPIDGIEPNMVTTNVRGAWKQGYHGEGIVLGVVDTGVWYTHDDLTNHLWESTVYPNHGFNYASSQFSSGHPGPSTYDTLTPLDYYGHGTHCAGIATADGAYGNGTRDTMGIAPATKLMCLPVDVYLHSPYPDTSMENNTMLGYQFCVSPPRDPTNGADAITTSLGLTSSWLPRRAIFRACEENINAAGIPHMIAAGNEGSTPRTIRTSGDCPPPWPNPANNPTSHAMSAVITVGATDNSDNAASFTSIGPSDWGSIAPYNDYVYPPGLLDPDVMMPGVNILSTYNTGNRAYTTMSGTSMATPGAAGVVCLMLSKNPNLTPRQIDSILEMHAVIDLGTTGKDNTFGAGRINCSLAVAFTPLPSGLRLHRRIVDDVAGGNGDGIVNPGETVNLPTWIINLDNITHNGVTGKITKRNPGDPLFSISDSTKSYGTVAPNDSAYTGSDGYEITVSGSAVNGDVLGMDLTLRDANDSVWVNGYDIAVGAPVLSRAGIVVYDPGGNNNGILDPGESVTMVVLLANGGLGNAYNVQATLASSDVRLAVTDPNGVYGTIRRDSTGSNNADRYGLTADAGIPPATTIPCTLHVTADGGYAAVLPFSLRIGMPATPGQVTTDHDTGYCRLTVSCLGSIGYDTPNTPQEGSGFCYPKAGTTALYYGGMMAGTDANYVVDRHYGIPATDINMDWAIVDSLRFYPPPIGDEMIQGSYDDAAHSSPRGLKVTQTSYQNAAPGYDDFVVMVFEYENAGGAAINGLYSGMIGDFDINMSSNNDAFTDGSRRAAYMNENGSPNPTVGYKLLYPTTASNLTCIDHDIWVYPDTSMSEGAKIAFMDGTVSVPQSYATYDWSVCVAAGPFDLAVGARQRVAYAVVGGSDVNSFLVNCDSAQSWYDGHVGLFTPTPDPRPLTSLLAVTPNPLVGAACIRYAMPAAGRLSIKVFDINGREVASLIDGPVAAGAGAVTWTPRNIANGLYFVRAQVLDQKLVQKVMVVR